MTSIEVPTGGRATATRPSRPWRVAARAFSPSAAMIVALDRAEQTMLTSAPLPFSSRLRVRASR